LTRQMRDGCTGWRPRMPLSDQTGGRLSILWEADERLFR
jgi:hypothetical protein